MDSPAIRRLRIEWQTLGTAPAASSVRHRLAEDEAVVERSAKAPESIALNQGGSPTVSHEGAVIQMGKRSSLSVEQMATSPGSAGPGLVSWR